MFIIRPGYVEREYEPCWTQAQETARALAQQRQPPPPPAKISPRESSFPLAQKVWSVLVSDPTRTWVYADLSAAMDLSSTTIRGAVMRLHHDGRLELGTAPSPWGGSPIRTVRVKEARPVHRWTREAAADAGRRGQANRRKADA